MRGNDLAKRIVHAWQSMTPTHQEALCGAWDTDNLSSLVYKIVEDPREFTQWILNPCYTITCRIAMTNKDFILNREIVFPGNKDDMTIGQLKKRIIKAVNCKENEIRISDPDQTTFGELKMRTKHFIHVKIDT